MLRFLLLILLISCASRGQLIADKQGIKKTQFIQVPFIAQTENYCGPASLAMIMHSLSINTPVEVLGAQMFTPGKKGTLQSDMVSAIRRNGLIEIPLNKFSEVLSEVESGRPVLVFQNLGFWPVDLWHYAVVVGYDIKKNQMLLHSGTEKKLRLSMTTFLNTWERGGSWARVIVLPGEIPVTASELEILKSAAALEQIKFLKEAELSYQSIQKKWPDSFGALIGLGNVYFSQGRLRPAEDILKEVTSKFPTQSTGHHNLAIVYYQQQKTIKAKSSALKAVETATPEMVEQVKESLKELLP